MHSVVVLCDICNSPVESIDSVFSAVTKEHTFTARCHGEIDWCQVPDYLISAEYGWKITEAVAFRDRKVSKTDTSKSLPLIALVHQGEPVVLEGEIVNLEPSPECDEVTPGWAEMEGEIEKESDGGVCRLPRRDLSVMPDISDSLRCM